MVSNESSSGQLEADVKQIEMEKFLTTLEDEFGSSWPPFSLLIKFKN
jgi:hypothetical protein